MKYAVIDGTDVVNVILADSQPDGGVDVTGTAVGVGWTYVDSEFFPPVQQETGPRTVFTKREFIALFTMAEIAAVVSAKATDATVAAFCYILESAVTVDLEHADTIAGTQYLESAGLIAAGRAAEILSGT